MYLNMIEDIQVKPTANIILNRENLKPSSLRSGIMEGCPLSTLSFNIILGILAGKIGQEIK